MMAFRFRASRQLCRAVLLLMASALCLPANAAPPAPLTLREAIDAALAHNPDLGVFEFDLRAADAVRAQVALRPAPTVEATLENFAGTGEAQGLKSSETTLALSQVIELGGKRDSRVGVAGAARDALTTARQAAQLDVLGEVTRRFIAVAALQAHVLLNQRATELAETTLKASDLRVRAAKAPHVEFDRATISLERARLDERRARSELDAGRRSLAALWGANDAVINSQPLGEVRGDLRQLPEMEDFGVLMDRLQSSPDFLRFASEERLRDAELRLAATGRRPDVTFSGGVRRLQGTQDMALVASFSIPLFSGRRADSFIAEAAARRDAVGAMREAALVKARAELFRLYQALKEASAAVESLDGTLAPRMEEALKETEYAFERGRYSYLELIDAQREYLDLQRARIDASAQVQLLATEIERLTNAPLTIP
jgi:cobalt-zinc-cadmium efflux system outer membrane protein